MTCLSADQLLTTSIKRNNNKLKPFSKKKQWYQLRFSSFSSCINFRKTIINKNQINRSDEDFELMGDMPKEDAAIDGVGTF